MSISEIIGDLESDFIESKKSSIFFDVSCQIEWSLFFIVGFAYHSKS